VAKTEADGENFKQNKKIKNKKTKNKK